MIFCLNKEILKISLRDWKRGELTESELELS